MAIRTVQQQSMLVGCSPVSDPADPAGGGNDTQEIVCSMVLLSITRRMFFLCHQLPYEIYNLSEPMREWVKQSMGGGLWADVANAVSSNTAVNHCSLCGAPSVRV